MHNLRQVKINQCWNLLDRIEDRTGKMGHEIESLSEILRKFQDSPDRYSTVFYSRLCAFWDNLSFDRTGGRF